MMNKFNINYINGDVYFDGVVVAKLTNTDSIRTKEFIDSIAELETTITERDKYIDELQKRDEENEATVDELQKRVDELEEVLSDIQDSIHTVS